MTFHQSASALLATFRHLLTGREMQICEHVIENSDPDNHLMDPFLIIPDYEDTYLSEYATIFRSLEIQFYREITGWIDDQDRAISSHTLLTHALLFAA